MQVGCRAAISETYFESVGLRDSHQGCADNSKAFQQATHSQSAERSGCIIYLSRVSRPLLWHTGAPQCCTNIWCLCFRHLASRVQASPLRYAYATTASEHPSSNCNPDFRCRVGGNGYGSASISAALPTLHHRTHALRPLRCHSKHLRCARCRPIKPRGVDVFQ